MLINPKYQKNPTFNKSLSSPSEVTCGKKSGALGNTTKCQVGNTPKKAKITTENNEISRRNQIYKLQNISADTLKGELFRDRPARVCSCCKVRSDKNKPISIKYDESREKASYGNLIKCGSVWTCPVCARSVSEVRRDELLKVAEAWKFSNVFDVINAKDFARLDLEANKHKLKNKIYLVTFTVRHSRDDSLDDLRKGLIQAFNKLNGNTAGRKLWADFGKVFHIRGLEVTWGYANGWHPHFHVLVLSAYEHTDDELADFKTSIGKEWQKCCVQSGLKKPTIEHGVDVRNGDYASSYINKFGEEIQCRGMGDKIDLEMTKSHMKHARDKHRFSPFQMLENMDDVPMLRHKFIEYSHSFFGQAQLAYSHAKRMKGLAGLLDLTDEDIVNQEKQEQVEMFTVNKCLFDILYINRLRGEFLANIERDIKKDGLQSDFTYTNDFIKCVVGIVVPKLETAIEKTPVENVERLRKIQERIFSCVHILQNPVRLLESEADHIANLWDVVEGGAGGNDLPNYL